MSQRKGQKKEVMNDAELVGGIFHFFLLRFAANLVDFVRGIMVDGRIEDVCVFVVSTRLLISVD